MAYHGFPFQRPFQSSIRADVGCQPAIHYVRQATLIQRAEDQADTHAPFLTLPALCIPEYIGMDLSAPLPYPCWYRHDSCRFNGHDGCISLLSETCAGMEVQGLLYPCMQLQAGTRRQPCTQGKVAQYANAPKRVISVISIRQRRLHLSD